MIKNIVFWKTSFGSRKSGFLDRGTQNDTLQYVRKTNLARLLGCKIQGLPIYLVRYSDHTAFMQQSGHTAVSERSMEDNYFLLFETNTVRPCRWIWWVVSGYLRLSPRYLPAIFTIDANLVPAISPLSPPSMSMWSRLSPAIFTHLWIFSRLSPAISRLSSRYLQVLACFCLMFSSVMTS